MSIQDVEFDGKMIYRDQSRNNFQRSGYQFFASYTPFGIQQIDTAYAKRIMSRTEDKKKLKMEIKNNPHLHKILKDNMNDEKMWKCKRCNQIVDMEKFKCGCEKSPAPWEPYKQEYVLGFVFDKALKRVLLIKKNKSPKGMGNKMIGLLNGLGGKVEVSESFHHAISREVKEEADLYIHPDKWSYYCTLDMEFGTVYCFFAIVDSFDKVEKVDMGIFTHMIKSIYKSNESEEVGTFWIKAFSHEGIEGDYTMVPHMPNIEWLIPMALNHHKRLDNSKFKIEERDTI
jgi:hypothetical protein